MSVTEPQSEPGPGLRVLAVDDEPPALSELAFLLDGDDRVGHVQVAPDAATALRILQEEQVDAVFLDVRMPGLTGLDLARVLSRFRQAPPVVFVTAHDEHAVDAFELSAVDYLLKPVRPTRLGEALRRVISARDVDATPSPGLAAAVAADEEPAQAAPIDTEEDEVIPVELAGVVRFVARSEVRYVAARGDYARLFTAEGSHLVRIALTSLADRWRTAGFVRVHRSHLVSLHHIVEIRSEHGRLSVQVTGGAVIPVSRRHARQLRDLLLRRTPSARNEAAESPPPTQPPTQPPIATQPSAEATPEPPRTSQPASGPRSPAADRANAQRAGPPTDGGSAKRAAGRQGPGGSAARHAPTTRGPAKDGGGQP